ncbi:MAG: aspartate-semialdehyde dehydrogenase [Tissierellia bacterium]|jgi:aspartate-semialdehyde dehydrogenase|nr:aspartate-semialdehyde dehydrogenase [Tissierellia bacterium]
MKKYNVAVMGATGLVGGTILNVLEERNFPIENLYLFSSKKSAGQEVEFAGNTYVVEELTEAAFDKDIDIAMFAAGGATSTKYAPLAAQKGIKVVDNSSAFRMDEDVPLVVPEINGDKVLEGNGIVANPNCSTIQSVLPLKPLQDAFGIKRVIYSSYQSVSGSGMGGLKDLEEGNVEFYPYQIQYNLLPHIDDFLDNGYTKEEMKMINETHKILDNYDIKVTATTVRVPVKYAHSVSINVEFERAFEMEEVYEALKNYPGIVVEDDVENKVYPMPLNAEGKDEVFVGRIRRDFSVENGINFFSVADNIRKGAATNAVQIAEELAKKL